jgi:protocatechuate 3,4-dioxygenase beta subunit
MKKKDLVLARRIKTTKNTKILLSVLCVLCVFVVLKSSQAFSQTKAVKRSAGSITGRVMLDGKAAPGVTVSITKIDDNADSEIERLRKATTDDDGRFRMSGLEAGSYIVTPSAPVFVASSKNVSINGGETLEDINFTLSRGGVITGRVADSDGKPIIGAYLLLHRFDENGRPIGFFHNQILPETDDRGIYRLYGLPAGTYMVSAEQSREGGRGYERNFYKSSSDSSDNRDQKPSVIEVTAGSEIKDIDITLYRAPRSYEVSGRVIDAESGRPIPDIQCGYGWIGEDGKFDGNFLYGFATNSRGEFRFSSLSPGRYAAFAVSEGTTGLYSPPVPFQLTDQDLAGVEIKVLPGSSISGIAVIEGTNDPELLSKISQLELSASIYPREENFPNFFSDKDQSRRQLLRYRSATGQSQTLTRVLQSPKRVFTPACGT